MSRSIEEVANEVAIQLEELEHAITNKNWEDLPGICDKFVELLPVYMQVSDVIHSTNQLVTLGIVIHALIGSRKLKSLQEDCWSEEQRFAIWKPMFDGLLSPVTKQEKD